MKNILFPTKPPYVTKDFLYIPVDMNLAIKGLKGNDFLYLIVYHADRYKSDYEKRNFYLSILKKSKVTEWRRKKRLKKLGLI